MKIASFPGMFALRYPLWSPDENGGEEIDPAFVEQPGDRMPDPDDPPPADDPPADPDADADPPADDPPADDPPAAAAAGDDPPADADPDADPDADENAPKPKKDWRDRQIIKARQAEKAKTAEAAALKAENEELKARLAGDGDGTVITEAERAKIREEATEQVRKEAWAKSLNSACDTMFDAGAAAFPKTWEQRVKVAGEVFADEMRARPDFLEAVTELDNAAAVYHELAGDPDKMEEVLNLPPHKMGMELARLSAKLSVAPKPKAISKAPPPIKPLDGPTLQERALEDLANDQSPKAQAEFFRRMDAEERKRAGAR